ncbi:MAG: hypothetical protein ABIQ30_09660 [Devosia sp.]
MRGVTLTLAAMTAAAFGLQPALAQDAAKPSFRIEAWNYAIIDPVTPNVGTGHGATLTGTLPVSDDLSLGADLTLEVTTDLGAGVVALSTPEVVLRAASVMAGTFEILDAGTALGTSCVMPTGGSSNFTTEDLMSFGTCTGYSAGSSLLYTSPAMSGVTVYLSAMADPLNHVAVGDVDTAISAALGFEQELGDAKLTASVGIDKALSLKGGGGPLPTLFQAGANIAWTNWSVGAAGQFEKDSIAGGDSWSIGTGASVNITEPWALMAEAAVSGYQSGGTPNTQYSLGLVTQYEVVKDVLWLDASLNSTYTDAGGVGTTAYSVGLGTYVAHDF